MLVLHEMDGEGGGVLEGGREGWVPRGSFGYELLEDGLPVDG